VTRQPLAQQPAHPAVLLLRFHLLARHDSPICSLSSTRAAPPWRGRSGTSRCPRGSP
jgi:hypothetical protein